MTISMKWIRKCPLFLLLLSSGILLTLIGLWGKNSIYATQNYDWHKMPILSVALTGLNENIYPWQMLAADGNAIETATSEAATGASSGATSDATSAATASPTAAPTPSPTAAPTSSPTAASTPVPEETPPLERLEPLRESTYEEYINHISADIYGDAGVLRAAEYAFSEVDESYFDDALFIGDSRTVGLYDYTDLSEHADFYCETSLTIYKVLSENFKGKGSIKDALTNRKYGKIYLMVGINELGRGTTEDFMEQYTQVVDTLHELQPEALIFIQGIMHVSKEKNDADAIFNNSNIIARNHAIATLADNKTLFYIDMNESICDEQGNLIEEYTFDHIHLLGVYNDLWKQFLLTHAVEKVE